MVMGLIELRGHEVDLKARLAAVRADLTLSNGKARELPTLEERLANLRKQGPYRSADVATLETQVDEARVARIERARLRIEEAELLRQAETLRAQLEENGIRKFALPILENVNIAAPCPASWADMEGDTDVRFCKSCQKNVYNLSMMSREEAEGVLSAGRGKDICVRLYRRSDGTVLTQDCPVGVRNQRFWRRAKGIAQAGLIATALGLAYYRFIATKVVCARPSPSMQGAVSQLD